MKFKYKQNYILMGRRLKGLLASFIFCSLSLINPLAAPVMASPVQVFECTIFLPRSPLPIDSLDLKYTMRRHVIDTEPVENTETELWSQSKFADGGTFELDIYPLEGNVRTEYATGISTVVLDGKGKIRDELEDKGVGTTENIQFEGFVVEEFSVIFVKNDGSVIADHLSYPEELDPAAFDLAKCFVVWRVPNGGQPCGGAGGVGGWCTHGTYEGNVSSVRTEEHEEDHGDHFHINAGLNDAWVNEAAPLQGMFLTVYPDLQIIFLAWFTYDTAPPPVELMAAESARHAGNPMAAKELMAVFGADDTRWVTAVGSFDGSSAQLRAELTSGGIFNGSDPLPTQDTEYGTINLDFANCREASVEFDFPSAGESGEFMIKRVLEENAALCEALSDE